mgnify:FL=1
MTTALLYSGMDQMLEAAELSRLLGRDVDSVKSEAVEGLRGSTDADFVAVSVDQESDPSLMVKHVHPETDWVALFTDDIERRAVRLWSEGVFARMPSAVEPSVIACGEWAGGYGILMPHLGSEMLESHVPQPAWMDEVILEAMAAMHASFWDDASLLDPALGLCTIETQVKNISPRRVRQVYGDEPAWARWIIEGWEEALPEIIDPVLARDLQALVDDPRPIEAALASYPKTLVHGDVRPANVGLSRNGGRKRCHFVDWGRAAYTAASVDLGWYLGFTAIEWPVDVEDRIASYEDKLRAHLGGRLPADRWEQQREIGLLAGLLQSSLGCRAYWGVRWANTEGSDQFVETDLAALRTWAGRLRNTLDLL